MAKYKIINTDLYMDGEVYPENSTIELPDSAAKILLLYLEKIPDQVQSKKNSKEINSKKKKEKTK